MKINLALFIFLILSLKTFVFAQGGWNIGYLKIGDITKTDIGKTFRADFKSEKSKEKDASIRDYIRTKDSNFLSIDNKKLEFVEYRKIYVDAGYYEDQFLICKKCDAPLRISDMLLLGIKEEILVFIADFELEINDKSDKINFKKEIEISRNQLDGLIFSNSKYK